MIFLTGDVHSGNLNSWEQKITGSEIKSARKYLEILKKYNIPCTLFINGICLKKDWENVRDLFNYNVEIGGHTYNNFGSMGVMKSYIFRKIWGCIYGPSFYQRKDIRKTKEAFEDFGLKMISWRTHSFGSNEKTLDILSLEGVKYISDLVGEIKPFEKKGTIQLPINIPVDVNTISYGEWKPENKNPFASCTKGRITPEEWFSIIKKRIIDNEKKKIPSVILIHPISMETLDGFRLFEKIIKFLSAYKCLKISEFGVILNKSKKIEDGKSIINSTA